MFINNMKYLGYIHVEVDTYEYSRIITRHISYIVVLNLCSLPLTKMLCYRSLRLRDHGGRNQPVMFATEVTELHFAGAGARALI